VRDTSPSPLAATEPFALAAAYHLPADLQTIPAMRIVVRNGFSRDLADLLLDDLTEAIAWLQQLDRPLPPHRDARPTFHFEGGPAPMGGS
jgi:hypothetical protein